MAWDVCPAPNYSLLLRSDNILTKDTQNIGNYINIDVKSSDTSASDELEGYQLQASADLILPLPVSSNNQHIVVLVCLDCHRVISQTLSRVLEFITQSN